MAAQSFGTALGNGMVAEVVRKEALWAQYRSEKALVAGGRDGQMRYLMKGGLTREQAANLLDSQEGASLVAYLKARTAGDRPTELMARAEALSQFSAFTYGALNPESAGTASNQVSVDAGVRELHVFLFRTRQISNLAGLRPFGSRLHL